MTGRRTAPPAGPTTDQRRLRSGAAAVRGLLALVVLVALVVGIPLLLLALTPTSFPQGLPGPGDLLEGLTQRDDGTLFLAVLTVAAWVGWATFAVAVLLEVPAQLRGVPPVRVRGLGVQQSLAGGLVAAVFAIVLVPGAASAAVRAPAPVAAPPGGGVAATASAVPGAIGGTSSPARAAARPLVASPGGAAAEPGATQARSGRVHVVQPGDTLWDLAEQHLGDGGQWRRIARLNYDRVQPDGDRLDRTHVLRAGWRLELPVSAQPARATAHEHVVRPGETLSGIAAQELGDATRYPELARATEGVVQPDGRRLTDPDLIVPGWRVVVPPSAQPSVAQTTAPGGRPTAPPAEPDALDPSWGDAADDEGPQPARQLSDASVVGGTPEADVDGGGGLSPQWGFSGRTGAPLHGASAFAPSADPAPAADPLAGLSDDELADGIDVRTRDGAGALLAASLVTLLAARRARQQRRRRPGQRIPAPAAPASTTEAQLRSVADPVGLAQVDLALRSLAGASRAGGRSLPALRMARLTGTHLEVHLVEAGALPPPWRATQDPAVWSVRHDALEGLDDDADLRAPYPALVTVGHDAEGAHVLVDLEQVATLGLDGPPERTLPVLAALAVELATSPWADDLLVTLVGCLPELPGAVASGRLRHVDSVDRLVLDLEGRALDVERVLRSAGVADLAAARGAGVAGDTWSPEIVLMAHDVPASVRARLEAVLHRLPRVGLAAVSGGGDLASPWRLQLAPDGTARLEPGGERLRPQRLGGAELENVVELLHLTDAPAVPGPAWAAGLPDGEPPLADAPAIAGPASGPVREALPPPQLPVEDEHRAPAAAPEVRLFGPVAVVGATGPEPVVIKDGRAVANHLGRATALVAFLSSRPQGATTEQVAAALSPIRRLSPATIWSLASRTRKWLGSAPDGTPYYPRTPDAGAHRLHPTVRTDWSRWLELVGDDAATTPLEGLVAALDLVRGRPFDGVAERHYAWAEPLRQDMAAAVVDVAHEVARRSLAAGDPATARRACRVGRSVDPASELLWRDALRAEYLAGNRDAQRQLVEQLQVLADDLDVDLEPETERLLAELDRRATPAGV